MPVRAELFVGNLDRDVRAKDIEDVFDKYGKLLRCDLKTGGYGAAYAFLEFEEERDAEDALKAENGKDMLGAHMVVEWAKGKGRSSTRPLECYECGERGHFARDCRRRREGRYGGGDRDRGRDSRDRDRRDNSRDRSRDRGGRGGDRDRDYGRSRRERSRSRDRRSRS